jgi:hypothetical protein
VANGWCWFVLTEEYCWLVAGGWFVLTEEYCWLVADKPSEQGVSLIHSSRTVKIRIFCAHVHNSRPKHVPHVTMQGTIIPLLS